MTKVMAVTAYTDLELTLRPRTDFDALLDPLAKAIPNDLYCFEYDWNACWATQAFGEFYPAANPRAIDRFADAHEHLRSNLIQHSPIQWLSRAYDIDPHADTFVWLGATILKQGAFTGKPVKPEHVKNLLARLKQLGTLDYIPIPAIRPDDPIEPYGDNWQFAGSTIIAPRKFLPAMVASYRTALHAFVERYKAIPLDLAIWPSVVRNSGLPFRPYPAEYDASQLTNLKLLPG